MSDGKHTCGTPWAISKGPGRVVGAIARSITGVSVPLPEDFTFEYCPKCDVRNMTPELEARFLAIEASARRGEQDPIGRRMTANELRRALGHSKDVGSEAASTCSWSDKPVSECPCGACEVARLRSGETTHGLEGSLEIVDGLARGIIGYTGAHAVLSEPCRLALRLVHDALSTRLRVEAPRSSDVPNEWADVWECEVCAKTYETTRPEGQWCANGHEAKLVGRRLRKSEVRSEVVTPPADEAPPPNDKPDVDWTYVALTIGFNELAKQHPTLGEKVYFRLLRDTAERKHVEHGGQPFITRADGVMEIQIPGGPPHVVFREQDIEGMRAVVAAHDAKKGSETAIPTDEHGSVVDVDAVAKAIYEAFERLHANDTPRAWKSDQPWDSDSGVTLCEWERDEHRELARAAIGALPSVPRRPAATAADIPTRLLALWHEANEEMAKAAGQSGFEFEFTAWSGATKDLLIALGYEWDEAKGDYVQRELKA